MKKCSVGNNIVFLITIIMLIAGCGLKGNPVSVTSMVNQTRDEQGLTANFRNGAVELTWPSPKENYSHVKVEKSDLGPTNSVCKDCPSIYKDIADLTLTKEGRFVDGNVVKGNSYIYRLSLCDEAGACRSSQTSRVDIK